MTDREYHSEVVTPPLPIDPGAHELVKVAHVGSWWIGTCSCGAKTKILPDRWRVERAHKTHVRYERSIPGEQQPRSG